MKSVGHYCSVSCEYDVDHEISRMVAMVDMDIAEINSDTVENKRLIIKAMISELMDHL